MTAWLGFLLSQLFELGHSWSAISSRLSSVLNEDGPAEGYVRKQLSQLGLRKCAFFVLAVFFFFVVILLNAVRVYIWFLKLFFA